ncbi:MAG: hydroxyisourate hydrolase [Gemmatimonadales bacterium]
MSTISTHVLDTSLGKPAPGIRVTLEREGSVLGAGVTDADGRVGDLVSDGSEIGAGEYALRFSVGEYFSGSKRDSFYGEIVIVFRLGATADHYHVPLLLSPFGYSTYRGS